MEQAMEHYDHTAGDQLGLATEPEAPPVQLASPNDPRVTQVYKSIQDAGAKVFYEKVLTASDAAGSGRVVVPKAVAEMYFPKLELPSGMPVTAVDIDGRVYTFKWRFWVNNQSRMYLLEGAGELLATYGRGAGDVMLFAQKAADQSLLVAVRIATENDTIKKAPPRRSSGTPKEPRAPKAPRGPRVPGAPGDANYKRKRDGSAPQGRGATRPQGRSLVPGVDADAPIDGVFRAILGYTPDCKAGVSQKANGRWVATVDCSGELYQAFFDTQEDAVEVMRATGMQL